jgi:hypothetical protein
MRALANAQAGMGFTRMKPEFSFQISSFIFSRPLMSFEQSANRVVRAVVARISHNQRKK